jgi:flavin reductase (DIM6/NTAB) family NADH-FMN oxidoreductase RutF
VALAERKFRDALGHFATGVVIVTTEVEGIRLGATFSSFNSVSLEPPLILFSLARTSAGLRRWKMAKSLVVSILDEQQNELSNRFARSGGDKWADLDVRRAANGCPTPPNCLAHLECEPYAVYDGGDHEIFVCRVTAFTVNGPDRHPLIFYLGKYRGLKHHDADRMPPDDNVWLHGW